jgi:peptidoglycan/LPS O-acetylase OafA/YrhL
MADEYPVETSKTDRHAQPSPESVRLVWVDLIKALALIWIVVNHISERIFGSPFIANPTADWPPLVERLAQLRPLTGYGVWDIPLNLLRYVGWSGDQGVQLFLIVSGFGLTWGLLARHGLASFDLSNFYRRRALRIYPLWWGAHLLFMMSWLLLGWGLSVTDLSTYISLVGIRATPGLLYYFAPAWWFFGLLIQLYLVYPLLWEGLRRLGPLWLLITSCAVAFFARAVGLMFLGSYIDAWQRGAFFITRLPEFVLGISLAAWLFRAPDRVERQWSSPLALVAALVAYSIGTALSLTLVGMAVAPFLVGSAAFVLLYAPLRRVNATLVLARLGKWIGQHSYSLFLMHHPFVLLLVPIGLANAAHSAVGLAAAVLLTMISAVALEWAVNTALAIFGRWQKQKGLLGAWLRVAALAAAGVVLLVGSELVVRQVAPQEILGWGERPSLEPDSTVSWRLKPSLQIRLRWEGYDYQVTSNSLGFPGPEYPPSKPPQTLRILTTGDAFTSAEGVDTGQAWPRLLEDSLARRTGRPVEVLNFAITGYGPNQYAAVIRSYAPIYKPDLIIVEMFVNDYQDVLISDEQFYQSIGFALPSQSSLYSIARLEHLRRLIRLQVVEPALELTLGKPRPQGYFLGNFAALEHNRTETEAGRQKVGERLAEIKAAADQIDAQIVILMVPAPVQVCGRDQLTYYPRHVDLADAARFDLDLPQRMTKEIADSLSFGYYDLRPVLQALPTGCPYQAYNMHWTAAGHQAVANYLSDALEADGYLGKP